MNTYAIISAEDIVTGLLQTGGTVDAADHIDAADYDEALLGQRYDRAASAAAGHAVFVHVAPVNPPAAARRVSVLAFRLRFRREERAIIEWAAVDKHDATTAQRMQAAALRADLKDQAAATYIDLEDPGTVAGVQGLEALGLIEPGRAASILNTPVQPEELP